MSSFEIKIRVAYLLYWPIFFLPQISRALRECVCLCASTLCKCSKCDGDPTICTLRCISKLTNLVFFIERKKSKLLLPETNHPCDRRGL